MKSSDILLVISQLSVLLPVIVGIKYYKSLTKPFKILLFFFIVSILFEILGEVTRKVYHNNMPGQHAYTVIEFLALSTVFYLHIQKNSLARYLISINTIIFIGIAFKNAFYDCGGYMVPNDLSRSYSSVSMIVYTLLFLYYLFQKDDMMYMWEYPIFWICAGTLIYFGGNMLYVMIRSKLIYNAPTEWIYHDFHALLNIIAYCSFTQSFRCLRKQKKEI